MSCFTILIAYILPVILWHAFLTMPNEPEPKGLFSSAKIKSSMELKIVLGKFSIYVILIFLEIRIMGIRLLINIIDNFKQL